MIPNPYPGLFIDFEGSDGSGKSYFYEKAVKWLRSMGHIVMEVEEPGKDRWWGKRIYEDLNTPEGFHETDPIGFQKWFAIDSKENYEKNIIPGLRSGHIVITDRSRMSGICYGAQRTVFTGHKTTDEAMRRLMQVNESIIGEHFIWPDLCLIFDANPELCLERLKSKGVKLDAFETREKIVMVRANYGSFMNLFPASRAVLVDNDDRSEEEVFKDVMGHIEQLISLRKQNV